MYIGLQDILKILVQKDDKMGVFLVIYFSKTKNPQTVMEIQNKKLRIYRYIYSRYIFYLGAGLFGSSRAKLYISHQMFSC